MKSKFTKSTFFLWGLIWLFMSCKVFSDTTVPFNLIDNRVFVDVKLNEKGPYKFILDTGGSYVINSELTRELGVLPEKWFEIGGAGENQVPAFLAKMNLFSLGDISILNNTFIGLPTREIKDAIGFESFDGIFGSEFLYDYVVVIDFEEQQLTLVYAKDFHYSGDGAILPITFLQHPSVTVNIDGITAQVWVDTGDRSTLTLFESFVNKNKLLEKYKPKFEAITGWGVGGPIRAQIGEVGSVQLGKNRINDVAVRFPNEEVFSSRQVDGSIGTGLLRAFKVFIDYPRRRFILERNRIPPQSYDRSGMFFIWQNSYPKIIDVVEGGPAWEAGLRSGDIILSVGGLSFEHISLPELRERLSNPETVSVKIEYFRQGKVQNSQVNLRKLI
ncbi:MAG: aspartyl protease family protein [Bacteriovoracia bacterium]